MKKKAEIHRVRPSGRHLLTIGKDLIHDQYAAIVELVKNSYDADSNEVRVNFKAEGPNAPLIITISDDGHGMDLETVVGKWLVPSTDDKLKRVKSPKGRTMQGRKGVGRYAASILGNDLLLETVSDKGVKTTVYVDWAEFSKRDYLDEVDVLVESQLVGEEPYTSLTITASDSSSWNEVRISKLEKELKKLISPVDDSLAENLELSAFSIKLDYSLFFDLVPFEARKRITPYPIFELFDYAIEGTVSSDGSVSIVYRNQKAEELDPEKAQKPVVKLPLKYSLRRETKCGSFSFKIHVYDRESASIDRLISRGLRDDRGNYMGKREATRMLNDFNGIGVYRNGFRIRPLGDSTNDWLELNRKRIQNPAQKVGGNQVIGYVLIESEEYSGLEEKSARDGLKDNDSFDDLKAILTEIIDILEKHRYIFRRNAGLGRKQVSVERDLHESLLHSNLKADIQKVLSEAKIETSLSKNIVKIIETDEQEKKQTVEQIQQLVTRYQGQAMLGQVIDMILHDGGAALNPIVNSLAYIPEYLNLYLERHDEKYVTKINRKIDGMKQSTAVLADLFERLDPLATRSRAKKPSELGIIQEIETIRGALDTDLLKKGVEMRIHGEEGVTIKGWSIDLYAIFMNLINNSIYWMDRSNSAEKIITIEVEASGARLACIHYRDTGPGIDPDLVESGVIFDPNYSLKDDGRGLGLTIAGEAAYRSKLSLSAVDSTSGAYFKLKPLELENG